MTNRQNINKEDFYENYKILTIDDKLLCRCNLKKWNWYLDKNLAEKIDDKTIRLTFRNKGQVRPDDADETSFWLKERPTICVQCGEVDNLSRHHVVPYMFRKYFPTSVKSKNSRDILLLCERCHNRYEILSDEYKLKIAEEFNCSLKRDVEIDNEARKLINFFRLIREKKAKIPDSRIQDMKIRALTKFKTDNIDLIAEMDTPKPKVSESEFKSHFESMTLDDIKAFTVRWRQHFIDNADPQFLNDGWKVDMPL